MTGPDMVHPTLLPLNFQCKFTLPIIDKELPLAALSVAAEPLSIGSMVMPGHDRFNACNDIRKGIGTHAPESSKTGHWSSVQPFVMGASAGRLFPS